MCSTFDSRELDKWDEQVKDKCLELIVAPESVLFYSFTPLKPFKKELMEWRNKQWGKTERKRLKGEHAVLRGGKSASSHSNWLPVSSTHLTLSLVPHHESSIPLPITVRQSRWLKSPLSWKKGHNLIKRPKVQCIF